MFRSRYPKVRSGDAFCKVAWNVSDSLVGEGTPPWVHTCGAGGRVIQQTHGDTTFAYDLPLRTTATRTVTM